MKFLKINSTGFEEAMERDDYSTLKQDFNDLTNEHYMPLIMDRAIREGKTTIVSGLMKYKQNGKDSTYDKSTKLPCGLSALELALEECNHTILEILLPYYSCRINEEIALKFSNAIKEHKDKILLIKAEILWDFFLKLFKPIIMIYAKR